MEDFGTYLCELLTVDALLDDELFYSYEEKERVRLIIAEQRRKLIYLFSD